MRYISELISVDDVKKWEINNIYSIDCPTGGGKTTFCMSTLREIAVQNNKKIIIFSNRKALSKQLKKQKYSDVEVITYQKFQILEKVKTGIYKYDDINYINFNDYQFVILDEIHSLFSDSQFDLWREDCLHRLLSIKKNSIIVGLSATMDIVYNILNIPMQNRYYFPKNYDYIENIYKFSDIDDIIKKIGTIPEDEKVIVFVNKAKYGRKIQDALKDKSFFICSENNRYFRNAMKEDIDKLVYEEKFNKQVMICTKFLDNGFNIKDKSIKHIFITFYNSIDIIQSLGRVRIKDNQKINLYLSVPSTKTLRFGYRNICGLLSIIIDKENHEKNNSHSTDLESKMDYLKKNRKLDFKHLVNNDGTINRTYSQYVKYLFKERKEIIENGYENFIYRILEVEKDSIQDLPYIQSKINTKNILDDFTGFKLFKEDRNKFKDYLETYIYKQLVGRRRQFSISTINSIFMDLKIPYVVVSKLERAGENRNKTYWIVTKISDE